MPFRKGHRNSPEVRAKMSKAHKGKPRPKEVCRKISEAKKGHLVSSETREKLSIANRGKKSTDEAKQKISASLKGNKRTLGKPLSNQHKKRVSEALTGHSCSETTRQRISQALKGKYVGPKASGWRGGISWGLYPSIFNGTLKKQIRERDNYTCQKCGIAHSRHIHHINYNKVDCQLSNLVTLCPSCNGKVNKDRPYWTWHFIMGLYLYKERRRKH